MTTPILVGQKSVEQKLARQGLVGLWRGRSSRGSSTLEAAIIIPALLLIILLVVAAGRIALAKSVVSSAASAGARAASLARTAGQAEQDSHQVTSETIHQQGLKCTPAVLTDVSGFSAPLGTAATVRTTVTCTLSLGDLLVPGLPGSTTVTKTRVSVIDSYRER